MLPLRRQLLNRDERRSPAGILERLAGLNAQTKRGPVVGMWTRTADYDHGAYVSALRSYDLVRANLMRGAAHLVTHRQYFAWWPCLRPAAERMVRQHCPDLWEAADRDSVLAAGRELLLGTPGLTGAEIGSGLAPRFPTARPRDLGFAVRMLLAVVEAADTDPWVSARTAYVLAETALGEPVGSASDGIADLVRSYLTAFGPATAADFGHWSGLTSAAVAMREAGAGIVSDNDQPVFDVAAAPDEMVRAAVILPEFDNLLFCREGNPVLDAAKRALSYPPAQMHGCVMAGENVVAHWSVQGGSPARSDWGEVEPSVTAEWDAFTAWYAAMDTAPY